MTHFVLILNPGSRAGRGRKRWQGWFDALKRAPDISIECRETTALSDARAIAAESRHADVVVAVGGDGTINGVLSGLMDIPEPRPAMAILYSGTSPDFCRFHGIPIDPEEALATLLTRQARAVDVARIEYRVLDQNPDAEASTRTAYFGSSSNIGIGARVASLSNRWRPFLGDALGTGLAVFCSACGKHPKVKIQLDDAPAVSLPRCCNLTVAKNPFIASGLKFDASLSPQDGSLAVLGIYDRGLAGLMQLLPSFYRGSIPARPGVFRGRCCRATITSDTPCAVEFDGDPHGFLPATIDIQPRALRLIVGNGQ